MDRRRFLLGKVIREITQIRVREIRRERRHLRVFALTVAKHEELRDDELFGLTRERRNRGLGRVTVFAVAGDAGFGFFTPRRDISVSGNR